MSYTTTQLADAVLRELGVVDAEETPDTVDRTYVTDSYTAKFHELSGHGLEITYWTVSAIPDAVFLIVRDLMINEVRGAFGDPIDPAEKQQRQELLLRGLRRHVQIAPAGVPAQSADAWY